MTESEYLMATNRVKVSMALAILRDVLPDYGISSHDYGEIMSRLKHAETQLFGSYKLQEDA